MRQAYITSNRWKFKVKFRLSGCAQIIDHIKAFSTESVDDLVRKIKGGCSSGADKLIDDVTFAALVQENFETGNYKVIVAGDSIHPNVPGMIESIHSAPHLSFTIFLVDLHTSPSGFGEIIIKPGIVSSTVEVVDGGGGS